MSRPPRPGPLLTRAGDGFAEIRDNAFAPAPDLAVEDAKARRPPATDGTFRDHTPLVAASVRNGPLLHHKPAVKDVHFER